MAVCVCVCVCVWNNKTIYAFSRFLVSTYTIVKSSNVAKTCHDIVHRHASASKHTKIYAVMSANRTRNTLQLTIVITSVTATGSVHVAFQRPMGGRPSESNYSPVIFFVVDINDINTNPMRSFAVGRIQVAH